MKKLVRCSLCAVAFVMLAACSRHVESTSERQREANTPAGKVGKAAHEVAKDLGKAAKTAGKEISKAAHQAKEGWKEAAREDREKSNR